MATIHSRAATREPGISFVCRARDEAAVIGESLRSLDGVTVPHEIIVICHLCTDETQKIVQDLADTRPEIRVLTSTVPTSRAGFETLATPQCHPSSIASYCAWCFSHAKYRWLFKWDADFTAQPALLEFLNKELDISLTAPTRYSIPVQMGNDPGLQSTEFYLMNNLMSFKKFVFWEVPVFETCDGAESARHLPTGMVTTLHFTVLKSYWKAQPWFFDERAKAEDPEAVAIAARYAAITSVLGPEPAGMARAHNPECSLPFITAKAKDAELRALGVKLFE